MKYYVIILASLLYFNSTAQELFPLAEPASSVPKGVLGFRGMGQFYQEFSQTRKMFAIRALYGVTSKLSVEVTASGSNHHDTLLPNNLLYHTHTASGMNVYSANAVPLGLPFPFLFAGFNFYAKYRIFSHDDEKSHFRIALFADYSTVKAAHDEAEPELLDDSPGYEVGFIATKLVDRLAISLTTGYINSSYFSEYQWQYIWPAQTTILQYGNALDYSLSIGYRFFPNKYSGDYSQNNFNIYMEFTGKWYGGATVSVNDVVASIHTPLLEEGYYIDANPGIQWIINSNSRVDLSVGYHILNKSYDHFYPIYNLGFQSYLFLKKMKPNYKLHTPMPAPEQQAN